MRAVHRDPDPAPHDDAVDQRDVRFGIGLNGCVEGILFAPEPDRFLLPAGAARLVDCAQIAARRERSPAGRRNDDPADIAVVAPALQRLTQRPHHRPRHGIKGRRPVQGYDCGRTPVVQQDFWFVRHGFEGLLVRAWFRGVPVLWKRRRVGKGASTCRATYAASPLPLPAPYRLAPSLPCRTAWEGREAVGKVAPGWRTI